MDVKLKVLVGANVGQDVPVPAPKFLIGRAEDCQLRPKSDLISRHHCVLLVESEMVAVRDLGSRNGTYVNDQRVVGERALKTGDRLRVGPLEFELHVAAQTVPAPAGLIGGKRPRVTSVREAVARTAEVAGGAPVGGDDDVTKWLEGEAPEAATAETRPVTPAEMDLALEVGPAAEPSLAGQATVAFSTSETAPVRNPAISQTLVGSPSPLAPPQRPQPAAPPAPPAQPVAVAPAAPAAAEPAKKPPAKPVPKPAGSKGADSGAAAADVLRNFFRRR